MKQRRRHQAVLKDQAVVGYEWDTLDGVAKAFYGFFKNLMAYG